MRKVHIDRIRAGQIIAKTVFDSSGRVLLSYGLQFKESYKERLKACGILEIYVEDELSSGLQPEDIIREQTRLEAKLLIKDSMENYISPQMLNIERIKTLVNKIIDEIFENDNILLNISDIRSVDDYTFEHSVNVCILSLVMAIGMDFEMTRLRDLGVGALLHDIGKLKVPGELLKKPEQLTAEEFEIVKKHTEYGFEILKENENVSMLSAYIAYGHHERCDGTGYPDKLTFEHIHEFARIVAVADVYDALTSDRVYRGKLKPNEVYEYITSLGSSQFDQRVVDSFKKCVAIYPLGTGVLLNTNERGLVVRANYRDPARPVVKVVCNSNNQSLLKSYEVDLSKNPSVYIVDSCDL